jgi:chemotaxis protein methyltransferase CheR
MTVALAMKPQAESMVQGEFAFTEADFRRIAAMVHGDAGIALPDAKATLVYSRLAKRLRALGLSSFKDYCALVAGQEGVDERQRMLAALTTNVTRFFREPHHFDHLRQKVLPPLVQRARAGGKIRIWSAACSSGQEPYSVAMVLLAALPEAANLDVKILATDIDPNVVAEAREGVYAEALLAGVPDDYRRRWVTNVGSGRVGLDDDLRELISFKELNLIGDWPMKGRFDAIFCRNVAIYFDDATQSRLWSRFTPRLVDGGTLYIGHSERVSGPAAAELAPTGITTYQLTSRAVS